MTLVPTPRIAEARNKDIIAVAKILKPKRYKN
jgi:hypothetical protein